MNGGTKPQKGATKAIVSRGQLEGGAHMARISPIPFVHRCSDAVFVLPALALKVRHGFLQLEDARVGVSELLSHRLLALLQLVVHVASDRSL